jgi:hypothetical protein
MKHFVRTFFQLLDPGQAIKPTDANDETHLQQTQLARLAQKLKFLGCRRFFRAVVSKAPIFLDLQQFEHNFKLLSGK